MDHSTCVIDGCKNKMLAKFLCSKHYNRLRDTGSTRLRPKVKKKCRMPGCDAPSRKLGWCTKHHHRVRKYGSPFALTYDMRRTESCVICGDPTRRDSYYHKYCSNSCAVIGSRGDRPKYRTCVVCGNKFSLYQRNESGRLRHRNATSCSGCKRGTRLTRHIPELAKRDGLNCSICSKPVDLDLKYPHQMSASVDHVIPWSKGGPDHITNYRLAHWICNVKLQDRVDGLF